MQKAGDVDLMAWRFFREKTRFFVLKERSLTSLKCYLLL